MAGPHDDPPPPNPAVFTPVGRADDDLRRDEGGTGSAVRRAAALAQEVEFLRAKLAESPRHLRRHECRSKK